MTEQQKYRHKHYNGQHRTLQPVRERYNKQAESSARKKKREVEILPNGKYHWIRFSPSSEAVAFAFSTMCICLLFSTIFLIIYHCPATWSSIQIQPLDCNGCYHSAVNSKWIKEEIKQKAEWKRPWKKLMLYTPFHSMSKNVQKCSRVNTSIMVTRYTVWDQFLAEKLFRPQTVLIMNTNLHLRDRLSTDKIFWQQTVIIINVNVSLRHWFSAEKISRPQTETVLRMNANVNLPDQVLADKFSRQQTVIIMNVNIPLRHRYFRWKIFPTNKRQRADTEKIFRQQTIPIINANICLRYLFSAENFWTTKNSNNERQRPSM